jgi:hypothetical protein
MTNIYFPVHVVALLRRLANAMATFSLSRQYLISRVSTENTSHHQPEVPDVITTPKDSWWNPLSGNKWDWLRVGSLVNSLLEQPTIPRTSAHPHWASIGTFLHLAFTGVDEAHAVIFRQVGVSFRTIPKQCLQVCLLFPNHQPSPISLPPTHSLSNLNCYRRNHHVKRQLNQSVTPMIPSTACCETQHCMTQSEPRGFRSSSATVSSCKVILLTVDPLTLIYRVIRV